MPAHRGGRASVRGRAGARAREGAACLFVGHLAAPPRFQRGARSAERAGDPYAVAGRAPARVTGVEAPPEHRDGEAPPRTRREVAAPPTRAPTLAAAAPAPVIAATTSSSPASGGNGQGDEDAGRLRTSAARSERAAAAPAIRSLEREHSRRKCTPSTLTSVLATRVASPGHEQGAVVAQAGKLWRRSAAAIRRTRSNSGPGRGRSRSGHSRCGHGRMASRRNRTRPASVATQR